MQGENMYSFKELQKALKLNVDGPEIKVAVAGNCATQFFSVAVQGYAKLSGLNVNIFDADYNQIEEQLLDPLSELYAFEPEEIILWLATDKLYEEFLKSGNEEKKDFAEIYIARLEHYWDLASKNSKARIIQTNFTEIDDKVMGNFSCKVETTFIYQIRKLNYLLQERISRRSDVFPVDLLSVQIQLGRDKYYHAALYYNAKMPVAMPALPYVGKAVTDVLLALSGNIKKCVVMDLDNTIWGGVVGDDGINHIEIGELGKGQVFTNLQRWLKQLKEYGIILAVCSKNDEATAKEPFEKSGDMVLRLDDISVFVANWDDKATNIKLIQETLNIGMNSIVFLDDNPFERNLVRELLPEVEVPELPEDPAHYLEFLQCCNYFESASYTGPGSDRTKLYKAEYQRKKAENEYESIDAYLEGLEMIGTANTFEPAQYSRIAQLSQRSNQFNLRTVRYTEEDIRRIAGDEKYLTIYYTLKDKFGEHGLVSVVILEKQSEDTVFIDTWLMSCRVLKRGMEEFVMNKVMQVAEKSGYSYVAAEYIPTKKNRMVRNIYRRMGFLGDGENQYRIAVKDYSIQQTFIREENEDG